MLNNVDTSSGVIIATGTDGYAISKAIVQGSSVPSALDINMTDYSSGGYTITAKGETGTPDYSAWKAFDGLDDGSDSYLGWYHANNVSWLKIELPSAKTISKYQVWARNDDGTLYPKDWTFEGSNDDSFWTVLGTESGENATNGQKKEFQCSVRGSFLYYRINITAVNTAANCIIRELKLFEDGIPNTDFAQVKDVIGKFEFANISESTVANTLVTSELIKDGDNLVIVKDDDSIHEVVASGVVSSPEIGILDKHGSKITLSNNNLTGTKSGRDWVEPNMYGNTPIVGNVYFENTLTNEAVYRGVGIAGDIYYQNSTGSTSPFGHGWYSSGGYSNNGSEVSNIGGHNDSNVLGIRYDSATNELEFYKDGVSKGVFIVEDRDYFPLAYIYADGSSATMHFDDLLHQPAGTTKYREVSYEIDTTPITQGEAPTRAYRVDEKVSFNDTESTKTSDTYSPPPPIYAFEHIGSSIVLSNSNLTATKTTTTWTEPNAYIGSPIRGNVYIENILSSPHIYRGFGITGDTSHQADSFWNSSVGHGWYTDGKYYNNGTLMATLGSHNNANVLGIRYNSYTNELEFYMDGVSKGVFTVPEGDYYFAVGLYSGDSASTMIVENVRYLPMGVTAYSPLLSSIRTFSDIPTPGRSIEAKVNMSATGNKMTQLDFDIMKEPEPEPEPEPEEEEYS